MRQPEEKLAIAASDRTATMAGRGRMRPGRVLQIGALGLLLALTFYPFFFLFVNSFKSVPQFFMQSWWFSLPLKFDNYAETWGLVHRYIANSLVVCALTAVVMLTLSCLAAFVFARFKFPGRNFLFYAILSLLMVPGVLMLVPTFLLVSELKLINSYWVLLLPYIAGSQVMAIFILRGFFAGIPEEFFEAARIDGASNLQLLRHVVLPLSKPIIGTLAVLNVLGTWNNFLWPQVTITNPKFAMITNGMYQFYSQYSINYGKMFSGYMISSIPILILILSTMRTFMKGMTSGAFKM
jgi:ABC-type glycerol-3-phosphate transport system permease component